MQQNVFFKRERVEGNFFNIAVGIQMQRMIQLLIAQNYLTRYERKVNMSGRNKK